jgi:hypothetical protein
MSRSYRFLLLGSDGAKPLSLGNPRSSVIEGLEAISLFGKAAEACDPDFVGLPVVENLIPRVAHWRLQLHEAPLPLSSTIRQHAPLSFLNSTPALAAVSRE